MTQVADRHPLELRIRGMASDLRRAFVPLVEVGAGPGGRPSTLARFFEVDRTLAARIVRAIRSPDTAQVLHDVPSPEGLRILLSAAQRKGIEPSHLEHAAKVVQSFERLIDEIPGGRSGLDATAAAWSEATQQRAEHAARQAVFKSMSSLIGFFADAAFEMVAFQPSKTPGRVDQAYLLGKLGMRRLRPGGKITAFGLDMSQSLDTLRPKTIAGVPGMTPADFLLREYCSKSVPPMQTVRRPGMELAVLDEVTPAINEPVSLVCAQVVESACSMKAGKGEYPVFEGMVPRLPVKDLVFDFLVHEDMFETDPIFTTTLMGFVSNEVTPESQTFRLDEVSISTTIERLPKGLGDLSCDEVPGYNGMVRNVFTQIGWEQRRFVGFRCRMRYPVPLVRLTYWFIPKVG